MTSGPEEPRPGLPRYARRCFVGLVLLVGAGFVAFLAGDHLWAAYHLRVAQQALEQERFSQARSSLKLCLEVWPQRSEVHLLAAQAARRAGEYEEAERHLHISQQLGGMADAIALESALIQAQQGRVDQAEDYLLPRLSQESSETPLILEALTQGYLQAGQLAQARDCVEKLLASRPNSVRARMWRGELLEGFLSFHFASEEYRKVLELDPEHKEARLRLAEDLVESGRTEEAKQHFDLLRRQAPGEPRALLGQARCCNDLGRYEEARSILDTLLTARPNDSLALTERGRTALQTEQLALAEVSLRKAVAAAPYAQPANYLLSQCLQRQGQIEEAKHYRRRMEEIEAALKRLGVVTREMLRAPGDLALRHEAGKILLNHGREQYGLSWLESVLRKDPSHGPTHEALADYYERKGQTALAHQHRQQGLRRQGQEEARSLSIPNP